VDQIQNHSSLLEPDPLIFPPSPVLGHVHFLIVFGGLKFSVRYYVLIFKCVVVLKMEFKITREISWKIIFSEKRAFYSAFHNTQLYPCHTTFNHCTQQLGILFSISIIISFNRCWVFLHAEYEDTDVRCQLRMNSKIYLYILNDLYITLTLN
jgi:hypothetical protein